MGTHLGRTFTREETAAARFNTAAAPIGPDPVVVLSHRLWRTRFGGDPQVVGRTVTLERRPARVVGVMPADFAIPGPDVQLFMPWGLFAEEPRDQHYLSALARLAPGATVPQAEEELRQIARVLARAHPQTNEGWSVKLVPFQQDLVGDAGRALVPLLVGVGLVLLVACANVALLSLVRGLEREHETAVRLTLGATRGRLLRQFMMEPVVVCAVGGVLGVLIALASIALLKMTAVGLPRIHEVSLDPRALLFGFAATLAAALISGWPAAWRRAHVTPASDLAGTPTRVAGASQRHALRDGLVVAEVAMAVVLLAGASLLVRSYQRLQAVDTGFDRRGVLVAPIFLDMTYGSGAKSRAYYSTLLERLAMIPGVVSAGAATTLPTSPLGPDFERPVWPEDASDPAGQSRSAWVRMATTNYFRTLGMRVVQGRAFDVQDGPDAPRAVILSQSLARQLWPNADAVGRRLMVDYSTQGTYPSEVVGVVNDVRFDGPRTEPRLEIYIPHAQRPYLVMNVAVRASTDPRLLAPAIRAVLRELDPGKPAHGMHLLEDLVGATYARNRYAMLVLSAFAVVAVLLSLLGIHGVLSHRVRERRREIGIRMAIGADRFHVLRWITAHGLRLVVVGIAVGAALAMASAHLVSALLFRVQPTDPAAAITVAALLLVGVVVSLHPAWRATRIDAAEVLRAG